MVVVPVLDIGGEGALLIVEMVAGVSAGFSYDDYDPVQCFSYFFGGSASASAG